MGDFASRVIGWQRVHGRHDMPWQNTRDPYRIWLSEIMLQQTQVSTVLPYYLRFLDSFPDVAALARAPIDAVLAHWSGLGYYRRAHHLHAAARAVLDAHGGVFPRDAASLESLPGIGRSTAAAISSFSSGACVAILDGNVKRVLARHAGIEGYPGAPKVEAALWGAAGRRLPRDPREGDSEAYTQGMMDLGATVCTRTRPQCEVCPVNEDCVARIEGRTDTLPSPRPAKAVPQRAVRLLVIAHEARVLFERRPAQGIWGGLWSLPECAMDEDPQAVAGARFGVAVHEMHALPPLEHAFTHFRLTMHPVRIGAEAASQCVAERDELAWLSHEAADAAGLPAPIRRLVRSLDLSGFRLQPLYA